MSHGSLPGQLLFLVLRTVAPVGMHSSVPGTHRTPEHHKDPSDLYPHTEETCQGTTLGLLRLENWQHLVIAPLRHERSLLHRRSVGGLHVLLSLILRCCPDLCIQPLAWSQHRCILGNLWVWALVWESEVEPLSEEASMDWHFTFVVARDVVQLLFQCRRKCSVTVHGR